MEIEEFDWNKFNILIASKGGELDRDYLAIVSGCLETFFQKYSKFQDPINSDMNPFRISNLESLTTEHNFCSMYLDGIPYCDVKFAVGTPNDN